VLMPCPLIMAIFQMCQKRYRKTPGTSGSGRWGMGGESGHDKLGSQPHSCHSSRLKGGSGSQ